MSALRLLIALVFFATPVKAGAQHLVVTLRDGGVFVGGLNNQLGHLSTALGVLEVPDKAISSRAPFQQLPTSPPLRFRSSTGQLHVGSPIEIKDGMLTIRRPDGRVELLALASVLEINDLARFGPGQPQIYPLPSLAPKQVLPADRLQASDSAWPTEKPTALPPVAVATAPKTKTDNASSTPARSTVASKAPAECTERAGGSAGRRRGESPKSGSSDANAFMRSAVIGLLCPGIGCISTGSYAGYRKYKSPKVPAKCAGSPEYVAAYEKAFVRSRKSTVKTRTWLGGALGTAVGLFLLVQIAAEFEEAE